MKLVQDKDTMVDAMVDASSAFDYSTTVVAEAQLIYDALPDFELSGQFICPVCAEVRANALALITHLTLLHSFTEEEAGALKKALDRAKKVRTDF